MRLVKLLMSNTRSISHSYALGKNSPGDKTRGILQRDTEIFGDGKEAIRKYSSAKVVQARKETDREENDVFAPFWPPQRVIGI